MRKIMMAAAAVSVITLGLPAIAQQTAPTATQAGHLAEQDRTFAEKAAMGSRFEVDSARLAAGRTDEDLINEFAERMILEHSAAAAALEAIAEEQGFTVPEELDAEHAQRIARISDAPAGQFEEAYIVDQIAAHEETIELFETQEQQGQNEALREYAATLLPVLRTHLDMAKSIQEVAPGAGEADLTRGQSGGGAGASGSAGGAASGGN
jgi:putative membrane protein